MSADDVIVITLSYLEVVDTAEFSENEQKHKLIPNSNLRFLHLKCQCIENRNHRITEQGIRHL